MTKFYPKNPNDFQSIDKITHEWITSIHAFLYKNLASSNSFSSRSAADPASMGISSINISLEVISFFILEYCLIYSTFIIKLKLIRHRDPKSFTYLKYASFSFEKKFTEVIHAYRCSSDTATRSYQI